MEVLKYTTCIYCTEKAFKVNLPKQKDIYVCSKCYLVQKSDATGISYPREEYLKKHYTERVVAIKEKAVITDFIDCISNYNNDQHMPYRLGNIIEKHSCAIEAYSMRGVE